MPKDAKASRHKSRAGVPPASSEAARRRMQSVRQSGTKPELLLRSILHRMGLRFRVNRRLITGLLRRADIVFPGARVAVFIDGCFWHGCPLHATWPKNNSDFWRDKIEANRIRDTDTNRRLAESGWLVVRVWEHENPEAVAQTLAATVRNRQSLHSRI